MVERATSVRWVPAGERVVVGRMRIDAGTVYVGEGDEPSSLDPTLRVDRQRPDWHAQTVGRPPRYADLGPEARAAYLIWLETGRRAVEAPSVWALLYLYGLERRVLLDGDDDPALRQEADELGRVYGHDDEVKRLATALGGNELFQPPPLSDTDLVPDALRIELGRRALTSTPLDAEWALAWAWFHPTIPRRTAATAAPEQFAQRWGQVFHETHPNGLLVAPRRRRLTLEHRPSNPSLPSPLEITVSDASDVLDAPGPEQALRSITEQVESDLETHVRWLHRNPGHDADVSALGTIPHSLVSTSASAPAVEPLVIWAEETVGAEQRRGVSGTDLIERWAAVQGKSAVEKPDALTLVRVLDQFGLGVEPDPRFGGRPVDVDQPAVLFRFEHPPVTSPSPAYTTALVTLELCAAVATADGAADDAEDALLVAQVGRVEGLVDAERLRLSAHHDLLRAQTVDLAAVAERVGALDAGDRRRLGRYLLEVARVDGEISRAERATLVAVHELLGLPAPELEGRTGEFDEARLAATRASNAEVQELLAAIFADDEDPEEDPPPAPEQADIVGLDRRHAGLLQELAAAGSWSRAELERAARRLGVMPDGALDAINEAAIDATEDPVIEVDEDESVTIDADVYRELTA
ncbi:TerB N-terminal domain-containing protein [Actinomycetospora sp. CA-101289]|uniref:TerB N-terminal domain-containing protein n=1 Tax=Actinomycetospora sp. CA-101289 TaxID=3239893 RepID=UPI003D97CA22